MGENKDGTIVWYDYDENGTPVGMRLNGADYVFRRNLQGDITGIFDSSGNLVAEYAYGNAWGFGITVSGSKAAEIGACNSLRYRGYYYDSESGLYYLNTRYYDPSICRFVNADGYVSTGQGTQGYNMYSYCGFNPVMRVDKSGNFFAEISVVAAGGIIVGAIAITATILSQPQITEGIVDAIDELTKEISKTRNRANDDSYRIYRYGGTNPGNLTPRKKDLIKGGGLSFSTIPKPGCCFTTIAEINATGMVYAVRDGDTHVSIYPIGGTMEDWYNAGSSSAWTLAVKSAVIKWDGETE